MTQAKIATRTDGAVSCGTRLWRFRGQLQLTVVVKAVFAIVPDGTASLVGPGEIVAEDRHHDRHPLRSVEVASDLAPYLARSDVLFVGHAHASGAPAGVGAVRLALWRDGQRLLDKTIHVYGDRGPTGAPEPFARLPIVYERAVGRVGAPNPIGTATPNLADPGDPQRAACFGPISCRWPVRRSLIGPLDGKLLDGPIAEITETMSWDYFQAAPPDQQIDPLRGGEWLVLDGLHPTRPRVQTRLPSARGAARVVVGRGAPANPHPFIPVELTCDTLAVDGDRQTFTLSWRGHYPVLEGEVALPSLSVLAALEAPGIAPDWAPILGTAALDAPSAAAQPEVGETVALGPSQIAALRSDALPFEPSDVAASPPSTVGTPWSVRPSLPGPVVRPPSPSLHEHGATISLPGLPVETVSSAEPPAPPPMMGPLATAEMAERDAPAPTPEEAPSAPIALVAVARDALPLEAFPIERCAATAASMARRTADRARILEENELTAETWDALVKHWGAEIRKETRGGRTALLDVYDRAYVTRLEEERGPIRVGDYAGLCVAAERGNAEAALADLTLPRGAMVRVERVWMGRMAADPALGASVREAVETARNG